MPISRLLIAEEYPVEKRKEILAENRYLLTGKRSQEKEREGEYDWFQEEVPVYRYQSAEIILQKVTGRMELKEKVVADTSVRGMIGSLFADPSDRKDQICYSYCEAVGKKCPGIIPEPGRELRR